MICKYQWPVAELKNFQVRLGGVDKTTEKQEDFENNNLSN